MFHRCPALALAALLALAPALRAQDSPPAGAPPGSPTRNPDDPRVHELLPEIGRIGAQVGLLGGGSWNPFESGRGSDWQAFLDLPVARVPGGKLSYELRVGLSLSTSEPFTITDPVAYVANLAGGASSADALAGPPRAPFPVVREVRTQLRFMHLSPFGLKYALHLDGGRVRPFVAAGADLLVTITHQDPVADESLQFTGTAPFDAPLIGGLVAQAPELAARGVPTGQGNLGLGGHLGAGVELRVSRGVSVHAEYQLTQGEGPHGRLQVAVAGVGVHF